MTGSSGHKLIGLYGDVIAFYQETRLYGYKERGELGRGPSVETLYRRVGEMLHQREMYATQAERHHLMTIKNNRATAEGGPYTPLFEALTEQRGWALDAKSSRLNHSSNIINLIAHEGPHAEYNRHVYAMMRAATSQKTGHAYNQAFDLMLDRIAVLTETPGTLLNRLATGQRGSR